MMMQLDQLYKNNPVHKVVNFVVLPLLTGFLFDLPWARQVTVSLVLVVAGIIARDFIDAIVALWQSTAVAAFSLLIVNYFVGGELSPLYSAVSILFFWLFLLLVQREKSDTRENQGFYRHSDHFILVLT